MKAAVMFSRATDEWETPQAFFDALDDEFTFTVDAAATTDNTKCMLWMRNPLGTDWTAFIELGAIWMNPPYSKCRAFMAKAAEEAAKGCTVVALVPSRTDTRWWFESVWDGQQHRPRPGVEVRFIKGRLKFGNSQNSAPFPSVVVIFRPGHGAEAQG